METVVVLDSIDGFTMIECKMCLEFKQVPRIFLLITKSLNEVKISPVMNS